MQIYEKIVNLVHLPLLIYIIGGKNAFVKADWVNMIMPICLQGETSSVLRFSFQYPFP